MAVISSEEAKKRALERELKSKLLIYGNINYENYLEKAIKNKSSGEIQAVFQMESNKLLQQLKNRIISYQEFQERQAQIRAMEHECIEGLKQKKKVNSRPPRLVKSHLAAILEIERDKTPESPIYKLSQPVVVKIAFKYFRDENGNPFENPESFRVLMNSAYTWNETERTNVQERFAAITLDISKLKEVKSVRKPTKKKRQTTKQPTKSKT